MDRHVTDLMRLGLTEGEAKVYVSLLKQGSSTVGPIVKDAGVAASNIYDILERLTKKGMVSHIVKSKTKYFQAAPPSDIGAYLQKKQEAVQTEMKLFDNMLPELSAVTAERQQSAEVFVGTKGLRSAYETLYAGAPKSETHLWFYYPSRTSLSDTFYLRQEAFFSEHGYKNKGIAPKEWKDSEYQKQTEHFSNVKYVDFPVPINIDMIQDKVLMISWEDEKRPVGILISSWDIAERYRKYFNWVWGNTK